MELEVSSQKANLPVVEASKGGNISQKRLRGPSRRVTDNVYKAVLSLLAEKGPTEIKMDSIAERSGTHKTTLYRRWGNTEELTKAAITSIDLAAAVIPDTGVLRTDMLLMARRFAEYLSKPEVEAVNRLIASTRSTDKEFARRLDAFWSDQNDAYRQIVQRAQERGELIDELQLQIAMEIMIGPMILRTLMTEEPVSEEFADQLGEQAYRVLTGSV